MNRESDGGGHKAQSIPGLPHRTRRRPTGESGESDAEDKVHRTDEYRRSQPWLAIRSFHAHDPSLTIRQYGAIVLLISLLWIDDKTERRSDTRGRLVG